MADDIVELLRKFWREITEDDGGESPQMVMTREAADLIARQRGEIGRWRDLLSELLAAEDSVTAFLVAADPAILGELEWRGQNSERQARRRSDDLWPDRVAAFNDLLDDHTVVHQDQREERVIGHWPYLGCSAKIIP
jgi:hypothetical protein